MESLNLEVDVDFNDKMIYEKLQEAEDEMNNTSKRYSIEDIIESIDRIMK